MQNNDHHDEIKYDPVPGYRPVFFLLLLVSAGYLAWIFLK